MEQVICMTADRPLWGSIMFYKQMKIALAMLVLIGLSACGQSSPESVVDLNDRLVPIDSGSETQASQTQESEEQQAREPDAVVSEELITEFPVSVPLVSLKEKILASSNVPQKALENAFDFYNKNQATIRNKRYMTIFDIGQHSGQRRLYLIDLNTGDVKSMHVAHGSGSDKNHDGIATEFSNVSGSNMSSLGFMLTAETYVGKHGESLRLDGLEARNSKVRSRAIVVHSASYVNPSLSKMGRSQGCPAVALANITDLLTKIKNGSLYYIYHKAYD